MVEILIALTLGVVIILGITTLYTDSSRSLSDLRRPTQRLTETASYAMDVITSGWRGRILGRNGANPRRPNKIRNLSLIR